MWCSEQDEKRVEGRKQKKKTTMRKKMMKKAGKYDAEVELIETMASLEKVFFHSCQCARTKE